jgi:hypothetical protein
MPLDVTAQNRFANTLFTEITQRTRDQVFPLNMTYVERFDTHDITNVQLSNLRLLHHQDL